MRGRTGIFVTVGMLLGLCLAMKPVAGHAAEGGGDGISYDQTASEEDQVKHREVGVEGMYPVCGADVADGVYEVEVESSSSMFRVEKAELQVREGEMRAVLTLGGTGYLKLFMGTKGEWQGESFIYQPGAKTGMLLKQKWIEGSHYFDDAIRLMERMAPQFMERKMEQWLGQFFSDFL